MDIGTLAQIFFYRRPSSIFYYRINFSCFTYQVLKYGESSPSIGAGHLARLRTAGYDLQLHHHRHICGGWGLPSSSVCCLDEGCCFSKTFWISSIFSDKKCSEPHKVRLSHMALTLSFLSIAKQRKSSKAWKIACRCKEIVCTMNASF